MGRFICTYKKKKTKLWTRNNNFNSLSKFGMPNMIKTALGSKKLKILAGSSDVSTVVI